MARIHVVTDSGSDLPIDVREKYNIHVVPLTIQFGDEIYTDGIDLGVADFYQRLASEADLPSTCQPSPADFLKIYEEIAQPGDTIISIHLSSNLSGTYQSAVLASTMVNNGVEIIAIDTKSASMGIGLVAVAVAEAVQNGATKEEAVAEAERVIEHLGVYFIVDTLENLKKNGRIGAAQALVGSLLNIKPILTLKEGTVTPFDKVRGKAKSLKRIQDLITEYAAEYGNSPLRVGITHANSQAEADKLAKELQAQLDIKELIVSYIGPTIGVHTGQGTIALLFYPEAEK